MKVESYDNNSFEISIVLDNGFKALYQYFRLFVLKLYQNFNLCTTMHSHGLYSSCVMVISAFMFHTLSYKCQATLDSLMQQLLKVL